MIEKSLFGTATLGGVIAALEAAPAEADVQFDFCYLAPTKVASYRGYYDHLALGWAVGPCPKVKDILLDLKGAVGNVFEGWKGGRYVMLLSTPVWVANPGETGGTGIVGVLIEGESTVILETAKVD